MTVHTYSCDCSFGGKFTLWLVIDNHVIAHKMENLSCHQSYICMWSVKQKLGGLTGHLWPCDHLQNRESWLWVVMNDPVNTHMTEIWFYDRSHTHLWLLINEKSGLLLVIYMNVILHRTEIWECDRSYQSMWSLIKQGIFAVTVHRCRCYHSYGGNVTLWQVIHQLVIAHTPLWAIISSSVITQKDFCDRS